MTSCIDHLLAPAWVTESLSRCYQTYRNYSDLMVSIGKYVCVCAFRLVGWKSCQSHCIAHYCPFFYSQEAGRSSCTAEMPTISKIQQLFYEFNAIYLNESQFPEEKSLKNTLLFANASFLLNRIFFVLEYLSFI